MITRTKLRRRIGSTPLDSIICISLVINPLSRPSAALSPAQTASSACNSKQLAMCALNWPVMYRASSTWK